MKWLVKINEKGRYVNIATSPSWCLYHVYDDETKEVVSLDYDKFVEQEDSIEHLIRIKRQERCSYSVLKPKEFRGSYSYAVLTPKEFKLSQCIEFIGTFDKIVPHKGGNAYISNHGLFLVIADGWGVFDGAVMKYLLSHNVDVDMNGVFYFYEYDRVHKYRCTDIGLLTKFKVLGDNL